MRFWGEGNCANFCCDPQKIFKDKYVEFFKDF